MLKDSYTKLELQQHREEWIAALRSGEHEQGIGSLKRGDAYCCLGVACKVAGIEPEVSSADSTVFLFDGASSALPNSAQKYFGFLSYTGAPNGDYSIDLEPLVTYNDFRMKTFAEIADIVEQNIPAYFED